MRKICDGIAQNVILLEIRLKISKALKQFKSGFRVGMQNLVDSKDITQDTNFTLLKTSYWRDQFIVHRLCTNGELYQMIAVNYFQNNFG